jgi:hypothetical protein
MNALSCGRLLCEVSHTTLRLTPEIWEIWGHHTQFGAAIGKMSPELPELCPRNSVTI